LIGSQELIDVFVIAFRRLFIIALVFVFLLSVPLFFFFLAAQALPLLSDRDRSRSQKRSLVLGARVMRIVLTNTNQAKKLEIT
jgi:hypothetical protein